MKICSLTSGSSGNSIFIKGNTKNILIDCGASLKYIKNKLQEINEDKIDALLITHEHLDHISGLGVLSRNMNMPIYMTEGTYKSVKNKYRLGYIDENLINIIKPNLSFDIGEFECLPFSISHDANEPVAFKFNCENKNLAVLTDLGQYDDYILDNLKDLDGLFIESNHDIRMLECGSYSYELKRRISSNIGHLSNEDSSILVSKILNSKIKNIMLGHLSLENNYPDLAKITMYKFLKHIRKDIDIDNINIEVALKNKISSLVEV